MDKLAKQLEGLQKQSEADQDAHVAAQKHYQAVSAGLSSNDEGQAATLNDQLISMLTAFQKIKINNAFSG